MISAKSFILTRTTGELHASWADSIRSRSRRSCTCWLTFFWAQSSGRLPDGDGTGYQEYFITNDLGQPHVVVSTSEYITVSQEQLNQLLASRTIPTASTSFFIQLSHILRNSSSSGLRGSSLGPEFQCQSHISFLDGVVLPHQCTSLQLEGLREWVDALHEELPPDSLADSDCLPVGSSCASSPPLPASRPSCS